MSAGAGFGGMGPAPPYGGPPPSYGGNQAHYNSAYGGASHSGDKHGDDDKLGKVVTDPLVKVARWIKSRNPKEKLLMGCLAGIVVSPGRANRFVSPPMRFSARMYASWQRLSEMLSSLNSPPPDHFLDGLLVVQRVSFKNHICNYACMV